MGNDFLKEIVKKKKEQIVIKKSQLPLEIIKEKISSINTKTNFFYKSITKKNKLCLIAEIKKSSPSNGILRDNFSPLQIAFDYIEAGTDAISILTEEEYFGGDISYIPLVKEKFDIPILRKDFIIDTYQIYESKIYRADAILLIVELFSRDTLSEYLDLSGELGLDCLLEVHSDKDLKKVLSLKKARIIGINNRNLHNLEIDLKTTERLFPFIPKERTVVVESGISKYQDVLFLKILGINAVLIGEAFMKSYDIKRTVKEMMGW
ncbi:MAG: indole-3-glycerol phosphate synthase TrpC [Candidatus Omnitrophica bacterium]|nr:indole-3-glycerol phosphate synthase TrpC [Candidatus Omnitrophota bacterium]